MQDIQAIFNRIQENKDTLKELKSIVKDVLDNTEAYKSAVEEAKMANEKKKSIKRDVEAGLQDELVKIDDLKIDIESDLELLTDAAMTMVTKGQSIQISDKYDNEYEPVFNVKFKKMN